MRAASGNVLVTGASGFIGRALVRWLINPITRPASDWTGHHAG
jgi:nucleoside-diphosphate-sugar epimerase